MSAKLVAEEGALKGLVLSLEEGEQWVIGRDPDACQLLVEDPSASRKHLVCRTSPSGIIVENLSLTNPTEINEEEVKEPRLLHNGDSVKIGDGIFRFYADAAAHLFKESSAPLDEPLITHQEEEPSQNGQPIHSREQESQEIEQELEQKAPHDPSTSPDNTDLSLEEFDGPDEKSQENIEEINDLPQNESLSEGKAHETPSTPSEENDDVINKNLESVLDETAEEAAKEHESPSIYAPQSEIENEDEASEDTIYDEDTMDKSSLAEINFGLLDTGRWLLKVVGGPNNGAEFSMQTGSSYVIGTDPNTCDIVFHDTSVSRQHARIGVEQDESLTIEDLKSRNGTTVDGEPLTGKRKLPTNIIVTLGTTSFVVFDREGEMYTIISPLMPSIVNVLKQDEAKVVEQKQAEETPEQILAKQAAAVQAASVQATPPVENHHSRSSAMILIAILTGLFIIIGIGTATLFRSEPVQISEIVNPTQVLDNTLVNFPSVKYTFNKSTGQLLLVGHVATTTERSQLLYALRGVPFIKNLDDNGLVVDELVWREINQIMEKNPELKGISVISTKPGEFVVTGFLKTRSQSDRLAEYLSSNFPYPDLLENKVVIEEDVVSEAMNILQNNGLKTIAVKLVNGELTVTGGVAKGKDSELKTALNEIKTIRGVRTIRNATTGLATQDAFVNISDKYDVTGVSKHGDKLSVVINGRILMKGDILDGMSITDILPNSIHLEKDGTKYHIDFTR